MDALKVNWVLSVYICRTGIGPVSLYSVHRDRLSIPIADLTPRITALAVVTANKFITAKCGGKV